MPSTPVFAIGWEVSRDASLAADLRTSAAIQKLETVNEFSHAGQGEPVKDLLAPLLIGHDASIAQDRKVMGDRGPAEATTSDQIADTFFIRFAQLVDDAEPSLVSQRMEHHLGC